MEFKREYLTKKGAEEIEKLGQLHNAEVGPFPGAVVNVDWEYISASVNREEDWLLYTARDKGKLVGYAFYSIGPSVFFKDNMMANMETLFLDPEYRKGFTGFKFLKWIDLQIVQSGANWIYTHCKSDKNLGKLWEKLGHKEVDKIYAKEV